MQSIVNKNYKKLVLKISLTGFSYIIVDTLTDKVILVREVSFAEYPNPYLTVECYKTAFKKHTELNNRYDEVVILHHNQANAFVPEELYDEQFPESYLQYNVKVFLSDMYLQDYLSKYQLYNVYVPYVVINNFLEQKFSRLKHIHQSSILVEKILELPRQNDKPEMFVHFDKDSFQIVVTENHKLIFYNSFLFNTKEDFAYYLLFTVEQLGLNPEEFELNLLGHVGRQGELFQIAYTYIRHIKLLDVSHLYTINELDENDNLTFFTLVQA
ncbi:MAG: DUF3822 family protein [Bacteroidota bacterium]|nr:DUF3822 family protein [Bacteroidota bacterium]